MIFLTQIKRHSCPLCVVVDDLVVVVPVNILRRLQGLLKDCFMMVLITSKSNCTSTYSVTFFKPLHDNVCGGIGANSGDGNDDEDACADDEVSVIKLTIVLGNILHCWICFTIVCN